MRVCEKVFGSDLTLSTLLFPYSDLLHRLSHSQYLKRFLWLLWQVLLWFPPFLQISLQKSLLSFPLKFLCLFLLNNGFILLENAHHSCQSAFPLWRLLIRFSLGTFFFFFLFFLLHFLHFKKTLHSG